MKILVVFTGGTIGSTVSDGWIAPTDEMKYLLIKKYREITGDDTEFATLNPYTILSENLSSEHLNILTDAVVSNIALYDGIIVTHGSDTLQYSASALAYAVGCESVPVVLVSSNFPLEDERANGIYNFIGAVEFIKSQTGRGVFVSYRNKTGPVQIHRATRTICHMEANDELYSIDNEPFAYFENSIIINENYKKSGYSSLLNNAFYCENPGILVVNVLPGECYDYDLSQYKAVIFRPYHSGTLNTSSEKLKNFCERAKNRRIPAFLVNASVGTTYISSKEFDDMGLTVLPMCSFPAIYMKVWLGINKNLPIVDFVTNPISEELYSRI